VVHQDKEEYNKMHSLSNLDGGRMQTESETWARDTASDEPGGMNQKTPLQRKEWEFKRVRNCPSETQCTHSCEFRQS
jgi:hypothetical protein